MPCALTPPDAIQRPSSALTGLSRRSVLSGTPTPAPDCCEDRRPVTGMTQIRSPQKKRGPHPCSPQTRSFFPLITKVLILRIPDILFRIRILRTVHILPGSAGGSRVPPDPTAGKNPARSKSYVRSVPMSHTRSPQLPTHLWQISHTPYSQSLPGNHHAATNLISPQASAGARILHPAWLPWTPAQMLRSFTN